MLLCTVMSFSLDFLFVQLEVVVLFTTTVSDAGCMKKCYFLVSDDSSHETRDVKSKYKKFHDLQ